MGTIALSIRWLTTFGTGDINCMIIGVSNSNTSITRLGELLPYPNAAGIGMVNYAQMNHICIGNVYTLFAQYLPYLLLIQTLSLVVIEKFTFKYPKITQRMERFYTNIVQESLLGKDPDVAEYISDSKISAHGLARQRQRNEICISLKRSNIIYHVYIIKNCLKIILILGLYLPMNVAYASQEKEQTPSQCDISVPEIDNLLSSVGILHFLCEGKKVGLFLSILWVHIFLISLHALCSMGSIIWCVYFRSLSGLYKIIKKSKLQGYEWERDSALEAEEDLTKTGKDFLFLFDLLAHCCGLEATLRVLTHSDNQFYSMFKPNLDPERHLTPEETGIKIEWYPANVEKWLNNNPSSLNQSSIHIDSYEVTIFPAENVNNVKVLPAKNHARTADDIEIITRRRSDTEYRYTLTLKPKT